MSGLVIYVEGGGDSADGRAALRRGFGDFLSAFRDTAYQHGIRWKIVPCGGRGEAYHAFKSARMSDPNFTPLLLVDSEGPTTSSPAAYLTERDQWDFTNCVEDNVSMMVQVMETWLIADRDLLSKFYGQRFLINALPKAADIETVSKRDIERILVHATKSTQKGTYHKIKHGAALLSLLHPEIVRRVCPSCDRFFRRLEQLTQI